MFIIHISSEDLSNYYAFEEKVEGVERKRRRLLCLRRTLLLATCLLTEIVDRILPKVVCFVMLHDLCPQVSSVASPSAILRF